MPNLTRRLEKLEQRFEQRRQVLSRLDPRCICYPEGTTPFVGLQILVDIAFMVKCPLHGDRFDLKQGSVVMYVSRWMREKQYQLVFDRSPSLYVFSKLPRRISEQYRKAHLAGLPPDLWPGVEEPGTETEGYGTYLRLQDGTRIQVCPGNSETMVTMAGLKERGKIVDPSLYPVG